MLHAVQTVCVQLVIVDSTLILVLPPIVLVRIHFDSVCQILTLIVKLLNEVR